MKKTNIKTKPLSQQTIDAIIAYNSMIELTMKLQQNQDVFNKALNLIPADELAEFERQVK